MKKLLHFFLIFVLIFVSGLIGWLIGKSGDEKIISISKNLPKPRPLAVYSIEALSEIEIDPGRLEIKDAIKEEDDFTSYLFEFEFEPNPARKKTKTTTGLINVPIEGENLPIILMLRGYVDQEIYTTGMGVRSASEFFATNGFITVAPDFLGYAGSDEEAGNIFESRFQTYTTTLALLKTLEQINSPPGNLAKSNSDSALISGSPQITNSLISYSTLSIWSHSNGAQIALTVLEITKGDYPTTLWAPVSKPFPYSILYYTDESEDRGRLIRRELAKFEDLYDTDKYSVTEYLDRIQAPLQIHQGTLDDAVPKDWSENLVGVLKSLEKDVEYFIHPGADHNMRPVWDDAVLQDLQFFKKHAKAK